VKNNKVFLALFVLVFLCIISCGKPTKPAATSTLNIGLSTSDDESALGAVVRLVNNNENPDHIYERIANTNIVSFTNVVRGVYTLKITHNQYQTYIDADFRVQSETIDRVAVMLVLSECKIGEIGPAGGVIFYDKGFVSDGWQFLEAAPASSEFNAPWGARGHLVAGTELSIGSGKRNTELIVARMGQLGETGSAAQRCVALNINGYNDWFLPSRDELNQMYLHRTIIGSFSSNWYWSSSQYSASGAWFQFFTLGIQFYDDKGGHRRVRAIRAFYFP